MTRIQVTYTYDRPPQANEAERKIARLDNLPEEERPEDYTAQRAALIDALPPVERIRIIVRSISLMDRARYHALYRRNAAWYKEKFGREIDDDLPDDADELIHGRAAVYRHAEVFCAIESAGMVNNHGAQYLAETQAHPFGEVGAQWQPATIPAEWTTVEGFSTEMPLALADALIDATMQLNGGVLPTIPFFVTRSRISTSVIG